jgi:dihydroxyacetone kinase-like predicted kinase
MSLDIRFIERKNIICPHCNEMIKTEDVRVVDSGGRAWYPILEHFGYYVPHDQRTEENDWYGKDMILTVEQTKELYRQIKMNIFELYSAESVMTLIAHARMNENQVVINADW